MSRVDPVCLCYSLLTISKEYHMVGIVVGMILLAVIGGYVVTSLILLRYPTLLHKKKDIKFRAVNIAHRGG